MPFFSDARFRDLVNQKLPATHRIRNAASRIHAEEYEVVFAIISRSRHALTLPFFSRLNLRNAHRQLTGLGYRVSVAKIPVDAGQRGADID